MHATTLDSTYIVPSSDPLRSEESTYSLLSRSRYETVVSLLNNLETSASRRGLRMYKHAWRQQSSSSSSRYEYSDTRTDSSAVPILTYNGQIVSSSFCGCRCLSAFCSSFVFLEFIFLSRPSLKSFLFPDIDHSLVSFIMFRSGLASKYSIAATRWQQSVVKTPAPSAIQLCPGTQQQPQDAGACRFRSNRSRRGLYDGKDIRSGNNVSFSMRHTKRKFKPNVFLKRVYSGILDEMIQFHLTTSTLRSIDKAGGLDNYLLTSKHVTSGEGKDVKERILSKLAYLERLKARGEMEPISTVTEN